MKAVLTILICFYLPAAFGQKNVNVQLFTEKMQSAIADANVEYAEKLMGEVATKQLSLANVTGFFIPDLYERMLQSRLYHVPRWEAVIEKMYAAGLDPMPQMPEVLSIWTKFNRRPGADIEFYRKTSVPLVRAMLQAKGLGFNSPIEYRVDNVTRRSSLMQFAYMGDWPPSENMRDYDLLQNRFSQTNQMFHYFVLQRVCPYERGKLDLDALNAADSNGWNILMTIAYFGDLEAFNKLRQVCRGYQIVAGVQFKSERESRSILQVAMEPMVYSRSPKRVKELIRQLIYFGADPGEPGIKGSDGVINNDNNLIGWAEAFAKAHRSFAGNEKYDDLVAWVKRGFDTFVEDHKRVKKDNAVAMKEASCLEALE